ncbi:MAG: TRAP transporter substrate-binding protein [Lachnospiraceae bacterium]|nr:TRAP transporter substrate-binding protein [Lachnospiraceae bacterium]
MKKRFVAIVLVAVLALSCLAACGKKDEGPLTLVYAEVNPQDTIVGQVAADFKAKVEELSKGKIIIDVQYSGVLGSENDVLDAMLAGAGSADISRISAFSLTSYGAEKSVLLSLPYTFESRDHFWKFATSPLAEEFLNESYEKKLGVKGLFYGEEGFRHFFTKTPVNSIGDLAGMKLRVSNDPVMNGLVKGLGASPTVVAFGELYSALSTGVVDGAEQPIANYKSNSFPEVANNMILDGHTLGAIEIVVATPVWDKLTKDQQNILMEAGKYAQENNKKNSQAKEDEVLKELKANGCNIVEVTDITPWQDAVKDVITENTKGLEDLYQKILSSK